MVYKNWIISDFDLDVLKALSKFSFLHDYHIAAITGENRAYVKGRLKQLAVAGLVKRQQLKAQTPACNWITAEGLTLVGIKRNSHTPTMANYEHNRGVADMCTWITLPRFGEAHNKRVLTLGDITTERDFNSAREWLVVGTKSDGTNIMKSDIEVDGIHSPDAFYTRNGKHYALEFERTSKSTKDIVESNVKNLMMRFTKQYWFWGKLSIRNTLKEISDSLPKGTIVLWDIELIREELLRYVDSLPKKISKKSGIPADSAMGDFTTPISLSKLPIINNTIQLEKSSTPKVTLE